MHFFGLDASIQEIYDLPASGKMATTELVLLKDSESRVVFLCVTLNLGESC